MKNKKDYFYVGASRARNRLFITSVVSEEEEKQMVRAITNGSYEKKNEISFIFEDHIKVAILFIK